MAIPVKSNIVLDKNISIIGNGTSGSSGALKLNPSTNKWQVLEKDIWFDVVRSTFSNNILGNVTGDNGDTTERITLFTEQQANPSAPYGDLLRLISTHGYAKGGIKWYSNGRPAQIITTNTSPFATTSGMTLKLRINEGSERTITFKSGSSQTFSSGIATADEISNIITKQMNYSNYPSGLVSSDYLGQAIEYYTQTGNTVNEDGVKVAIFGGKYGTNSTVEITGGTALSSLGLTTTKVTGTTGSITFENAKYDQLAWIICHDFPNDTSSNNKHQHISIEVPDSNGSMQTRIGITYMKDVAEILISSAMLIANGYPITVANSANSFKDLDFSRDNSGRQIARVFQLRTKDDASGGDFGIRAFDDSGTATELLTFNRLNKYIIAGGAIQNKIRPTANTAQSVMSLTPQFGNTFVLSGTGTVNYIANTNWQAGSEINMILQSSATLTNNAGSATSTNRPLKLSNNVSYTAGTNGSAHKFVYDGSGYTNRWIEISRIVF